jgi:hypothetical protein
MGQYWKIYNETKKEMLNPWAFGEVAKLHEWPMDGPGGMQTALVVLLLEKSSLGDGGGDFDFEAAPDKLRGFIGWWRGDKISIVGDYSHLPEFSVEAWEDAYSDISKLMVELMSYEVWLPKYGMCGQLVTPKHKWQERQHKPWGNTPDTRKPTLASVNGWDQEKEVVLAPDMIFGS